MLIGEGGAGASVSEFLLHFDPQHVLKRVLACWQVEEELEAYKRSGGQYLDKVDFLKRAELAQYEKERDARLGSDVRNRGRM